MQIVAPQGCEFDYGPDQGDAGGELGTLYDGYYSPFQTFPTRREA